MDGFGGLGLAAKIAGLWPKGWGDARLGGGGGSESGPQGYPGETGDHPGWNPETGTCSAHPQGCADAFDGNGHPWKGGEGFGSQGSGGNRPPEPGGDLEVNYLTGSVTWDADDGHDLHGQAAVDEFDKYSDGSSNEAAKVGYTPGGGSRWGGGGGWGR